LILATRRQAAILGRLIFVAAAAADGQIVFRPPNQAIAADLARAVEPPPVNLRRALSVSM